MSSPTVSTTEAQQTAAPQKGGSGDVDRSGTIDLADAVLLQRFLNEDENVTFDEQNTANADLDGDGNVSQTDLVALLQLIHDQNPDKYPVGKLNAMFGVTLSP